MVDLGDSQKICLNNDQWIAFRQMGLEGSLLEFDMLQGGVVIATQSPQACNRERKSLGGTCIRMRKCRMCDKSIRAAIRD